METQNIQTFVSNLIAVYRRNKKTYSILQYSQQLRRWRRFLLDPDTVISAWRQTIASAPVKICIDATQVNVHCIATGVYLKYGTETVSVIEKLSNSPKKFPLSFYFGEITCPAVETETTPTTALWSLYPVPSPVIVQAQQKTIKIPQRIAWLIAEDASRNNEECPITLQPLSPITASVTSCFHVFETEAINQSLMTKPQCPMCRYINPSVTVCFTLL